MLGGRDPVRVDRLDVLGIGLAAPADQEALGDRLGLVDLALGDRRLADAAGRLGDERERHHRRPREVVARLLVGDVDQLRRSPTAGPSIAERGLDVHARVAGADAQRMRLGRRQSRQQLSVDEQPPHLLERDVADQLLDVDAAVAQRAARAVRLGDLGRERDYALEAGLNFGWLLSSRSCSWRRGLVVHSSDRAGRGRLARRVRPDVHAPPPSSRALVRSGELSARELVQASLAPDRGARAEDQRLHACRAPIRRWRRAGDRSPGDPRPFAGRADRDQGQPRGRRDAADDGQRPVR